MRRVKGIESIGVLQRAVTMWQTPSPPDRIPCETCRVIRQGFAAAALCMAIAGCQGDGYDDWTAKPDPLLLGELAAPRDFTVLATDPVLILSIAQITLASLQDDAMLSSPVPVTGGRLRAQVLDDELLFLHFLEIDAVDIPVAASILPPNGGTVSGLKVALSFADGVPFRVETDTIVVESTVDIEAQWNLVLDDGTMQALPDIPIRDATIVLGIRRDILSDGLFARVGLQKEGSFWTWANTFEMADLGVDATAMTSPPATP